MRLTILAIPGCPNAPVLRDRLAAVLGDRADVSVSFQVIDSESEAARRGMRGSPTLLIDGTDPFPDPFPGPGQPPGMSCRVYRGEDGRAAGAPSVSQLQRVIGEAGRFSHGASGPQNG